MRKFTVDKSADGVRADVYLAKKFPKFTRSSLKQLFKRKLVQINNAVAKSGRKVHPDDKISVDDSLLKSVPAPVKLPVIYEDKEVVVINKPAGMLTHSKGALNTESTVASSLRAKINPNLQGNRAGIVHRLDRGTSGVMIIAKTEAALAYLQKQFAARMTEKNYRAVVEGVPQPKQALIDAPIDRNPRRPQTFVVSAAGKPAQTEYKVEKSFKRGDQDYSVLALKPVTGRTHQLRVHLKYIGHPVVGDRVYGRGEELLLHAASLGLALPNGQHKVFKAPLPAYFKEFAGAK